MDYNNLPEDNNLNQNNNLRPIFPDDDSISSLSFSSDSSQGATAIFYENYESDTASNGSVIYWANPSSLGDVINVDYSRADPPIPETNRNGTNQVFTSEQQYMNGTSSLNTPESLGLNGTFGALNQEQQDFNGFNVSSTQESDSSNSFVLPTIVEQDWGDIIEAINDIYDKNNRFSQTPSTVSRDSYKQPSSKLGRQ